MNLIKTIFVVLLCNSLQRPSECKWMDRWAPDWFSWCEYIDCCNKEWNSKDFQDLHLLLSSEVYGQNIALDIIVPALQGHLLPGKHKTKALVMSFHGRPGIGKNFVASHIQKKIFEKYGKSKYIHFFSGRSHFPERRKTEQYQVDLMNSIKNSVSQCEYSLFIFDEVDKIPPGVLNALVPYIDHHDNVHGIDFRKATFILISNTGGDLIAQRYLEFWKAGKKRESLRLADFENLIMIGSFNEKDGGLFKSDTIVSSLIDHYVPFLPLEEKHVRQCVYNQFKKRNNAEDAAIFMKEIIGDITFGPNENPIFANSGCKRIAPKVAAIAERVHFQRRTDL